MLPFRWELFKESPLCGDPPHPHPRVILVPPLVSSTSVELGALSDFQILILPTGVPQTL